MHAGKLIIAVLATFGATCACSSQDDWRDHNRPATYGAQCATCADCSQPSSAIWPPIAQPGVRPVIALDRSHRSAVAGSATMCAASSRPA